MTEQPRRWRFLEDNRALTFPGWLPPAEDCPALAELREAHERVLAAAAEAWTAAAALGSKREAELEAARAAEEEAMFTGKNVAVPKVTVTEAEITQARVKAQAARDALQRFVRQAVEEVREREPEILEELDGARQQAAAKRAKAQKLLAEADALEQKPKRIQLWLARYNGTSHLGPFPYSETVAPPPPEPFDMETALASGGSPQEVTVLA